MDVSTIATLATDMAQQRSAVEVSTAVLKKALDIQAQSAAQLIQAATQSMAAYSNPSHLGNSIDTFA